ncbi:UNVERIFIED_ORG: hypothetical protein J2W85_002816 [Ensifer adhaerens]|nr:hypothetical protein [Ensifer adhaerens]
MIKMLSLTLDSRFAVAVGHSLPVNFARYVAGWK